MKKAVLLGALACLAAGAAAQTLRPGDVAVVGYNADNPDQFAFVALVDLEAGTAITFTDNGWQSSDETLRGNEGTVTWTADADVARGTVVAIESGEPDFTASVGSVSAGGGPQFATEGDQLLVYQGEATQPTFLYALNNEGEDGAWQADATSSNDSALPAGLESGTTAIALEEVDNAAYTGPTSGSRAELLEAISTPSNWTGDNGDRQAMPSGPFTVSVPEAVEGEAVPDVFALRGNYPNPFNPTTTLRFDLDAPAWVGVRVFDLAGREVLALRERAVAAGPNRTLRLDASGLPSGLYLYRVTARSARRTQTRVGMMTLVK